LRKHLSVDGERLANVDISESQPMFVGLALAGAAKGKDRGGRGGNGTGRGRRRLPYVGQYYVGQYYVGQNHSARYSIRAGSTATRSGRVSSAV
jgi:hypothetical protein